MKKIIKLWDKIEESFLIFLIAIMGAVLFLQIVMRFGFSNPFTWPEEFARYCQVWITFLGIGYGIRKNTHVGMTLLSSKFNYITKRIVSIICDGLGIFISVVLFQSSLAFISYQNVLSTAMRAPMQFIYSVIPIGAVLTTIYYVANIIRYIKEIITGETEATEKEVQ